MKIDPRESDHMAGRRQNRHAWALESPEEDR